MIRAREQLSTTLLSPPPPTGMHHVFEVDEIVRLIAFSIEYEDRWDAVCFACCCKSFSSPVLDTIWGEWQRDLTRLLRTLPPSVWVFVDETFDFVRQPSDGEWARFSVYARRMRYFTVSGRNWPSRAALELLRTHFSGRCMLPNLLTIKWIGAPQGQLEPTLPLIISPILTVFRLAYALHESPSASEVVFSLEALAPAYNSLIDIHISNSVTHDPRIVDAASTLLLKCNPDRIRHFRMDSVLPTGAFIHATQLPNLESFAIRIDTAELDISLPTSTFPSLRRLEINATNADSPFLQSITHIQSRNMNSLDLTFPAATPEMFLPRMLAALRPRGLHQTLTRLTIAPWGDFDLDMATICPLLSLNQLTLLEVMVHCSLDGCPYKLSDENLEELVKAMPKLEILCLGPVPCFHPANNTIRSLVCIAKHCKNLTELSIHINSEAIITEVLQGDDWRADFALEDPLSAFVGCPICEIVFGPCFIPNDEQGATILAFTLLRLFPRLDTALVIPLVNERDPQWDLVQDVIAAYRRACVNIASVAGGVEVN